MEIKVKVKTNCSEQRIEDKSEFYSVKIKSSPVEGKANEELLKFLKKQFRAKEIKIKSGFKSKVKRVEIK